MFIYFKNLFLYLIKFEIQFVLFKKKFVYFYKMFQLMLHYNYPNCRLYVYQLKQLNIRQLYIP